MSWSDVLGQWKNNINLDADLKQELFDLEENQSELKEAFYEPMEFGTAGMRGLMGPGINRMNIYTVRQATEGLSRFMDTLDASEKKRGVVISFDSRYNSRTFAMESAKVLGSHGISSFVFDDVRPTPELSFAVRQLGAYAGIMITASHNPKQYNGYKLYDSEGGQMPPEESDQITQYIRQVEDLFDIKTLRVTKLRSDKLMKLIGEDVDQLYLNEIKTVSVDKNLIEKYGSKINIIYSPLHGTGGVIGSRALDKVGFHNYSMVEEQAIKDPEFSTVSFPNPEFKEAFDLSIKLGQKNQSDLLIATDPDADRLGAAVRLPDGNYKLLTGNQIAAIMLDYIFTVLNKAGKLPDDAVGVKSIVSSELSTKIVNSYGFSMINVLTGFKFIADKIKSYEITQDHTFMFGFEESYGYLVKPFVRDKDAIQALVLLAEISAYYLSQGKTIYDGLQDIFKKYGFFEEKTISKSFDGLDGKHQMDKIMHNLKTNKPTEFDGFQVVETQDFEDGLSSYKDGSTQKLDYPKARVLKYILEDGTWIAVRPSGTEPKIKFYIGTLGSNQDEALDKVVKFEKNIDDLLN